MSPERSFYPQAIYSGERPQRLGETHAPYITRNFTVVERFGNYDIALREPPDLFRHIDKPFAPQVVTQCRVQCIVGNIGIGLRRRKHGRRKDGYDVSCDRGIEAVFPAEETYQIVHPGR